MAGLLDGKSNILYGASPLLLKNTMKTTVCLFWWVVLFIGGWITVILALVGAFRLYDLFIK